MDAEKFDEILLLVLEKFKENKPLSVLDAKRSLSTELHRDKVRYMMEQMAELKSEVFIVQRHNGIIRGLRANGLTKDFLDSGGFIKLEEKNNEKEEEQTIRQQKQDESLDLELVLKRFNIEASEYEKRVTRKIGVAGLIITFLSFIVSALTSGLWSSDDKKPPQNNRVEMQKKIQLLSEQKDSLIFSLEMKVDSLHAPKLEIDSLPKN